MGTLREGNILLRGVEPYDPKYLPAEVMLSANESTLDIPEQVRAAILARIEQVAFNRYPDPLATELRGILARWHDVEPDWVLCGNGGDELLFDLGAAWGGPGNALLNLPPTFSVYAATARLTGTRVVDVPRRPDFTIDEEAVIERASCGDIGMVAVTSPNNPTGDLARLEFIEALLDATDALVLVDEAYGEFADKHTSAAPLLKRHENLAILHTFSKAYACAGVRVGYLLAHPRVIAELTKVRQPYSVDAISQAVAFTVAYQRGVFAPRIGQVKRERDHLADELAKLPGVQVFPSQANFLFVRFDADAGAIWQQLYDRGVLVRDFSAGKLTRNCLRISIGTPGENRAVLTALRDILAPEEG